MDLSVPKDPCDVGTPGTPEERESEGEKMLICQP